MSKNKSIYELGMHEFTKVASASGTYEKEDVFACRVPGGWIYTTTTTIKNQQGVSISNTSCFVPFNNEFKPGNNDDVHVTYEN